MSLNILKETLINNGLICSNIMLELFVLIKWSHLMDYHYYLHKKAVQASSFIKIYFKFVVITYKINNFLKYYSKESLSFKPKPLAIFFSIFTDGFKVPRSILDKSD